MTEPELLTHEQWLLRSVILAGAPLFIAMEAVHSVALEHPEWDMNEERTWDEWQRGT